MQKKHLLKLALVSLALFSLVLLNIGNAWAGRYDGYLGSHRDGIMPAMGSQEWGPVQDNNPDHPDTPVIPLFDDSSLEPPSWLEKIGSFLENILVLFKKDILGIDDLEPKVTEKVVVSEDVSFPQPTPTPTGDTNTGEVEDYEVGGGALQTIPSGEPAELKSKQTYTPPNVDLKYIQEKIEIIMTSSDEKERIITIYSLEPAVRAGNKEAINLLMSTAETAESEKERIAVIHSLKPAVSAGNKEVIDFLISAAKTAESEKERIAVIYSLEPAVSAGNKEAINLLMSTAETAESEKERIAVIHSLRPAVSAGNKEVIDFLISAAKTSGVKDERTAAIQSLKPGITADNKEIISYFWGLVKDDKENINLIGEAFNALVTYSKDRKQIVDNGIAIITNQDYPTRLRAELFYRIVIKRLINKEEVKVLIPQLEEFNKDKDITIQRTVAGIITNLAPKRISESDALAWSRGDRNKLINRESIYIKHNTSALYNKSGSYDRATIESIIDRAIYLGVDPYLALGTMMAENPIVVDGRNLNYTLSFGEMPIDNIAVDDLFRHYHSLLADALSNSTADGKDVVIAVNYIPEGRYDGVASPQITPISWEALKEYNVANIVGANYFLIHVSNLDTKLSINGNLGLLYLRELVQNKRGEDMAAGSSLALTIQRWNGLGYYGINGGENAGNLNGIDTRINPVFGNRVLDYMENALKSNKEITDIIEKYRSLRGKPVVDIRR